MMKIIYVIDDLKVSGAQIHLLHLANGLCSKVSVEVIALGPCAEDIKIGFDRRIRVHCLGMASVRKVCFWRNFIVLMNQLRRSKPDIVHTYLNTANVFGLLAARLAGVGVVVTSRRDIGCFRTGRIAKLEVFLSRHLADQVFCVCQAVANKVVVEEQIPKTKLKVIYNGVDAGAYTVRQNANMDNTLRFGMVATINREAKGHLDFLEAAVAAHTERPEFAEFHLAGDGPLRPSLEDYCHQNGIEPVTFFVGEIEDVNAFLSGIDVLVVPSHTEGISNALLEGMAKGLPAIATAVDGNLEVVVPDYTGLLVPPVDRSAMKKAFLYFADNRELLRQMGEAGRKRVVEQFSYSGMLDNFFSAYQTLVRK